MSECNHQYFRTGAMEPGVSRCIDYGEWKNPSPRPAVRLSAVDMLSLKPDNESIIDDQWLVRFAINIELAVLKKNNLTTGE